MDCEIKGLGFGGHKNSLQEGFGANYREKTVKNMVN